MFPVTQSCWTEFSAEGWGKEDTEARLSKLGDDEIGNKRPKTAVFVSRSLAPLCFLHKQNWGFLQETNDYIFHRHKKN